MHELYLIYILVWANAIEKFRLPANSQRKQKSVLV